MKLSILSQSLCCLVAVVYLGLGKGQSSQAKTFPLAIAEQLTLARGQVQGAAYLGLNSSRENAASIAYTQHNKVSLDTAIHRLGENQQTSSVGLLYNFGNGFYGAMAYSYSTIKYLERLINWSMAVKLGPYLVIGAGAVVTVKELLSTVRAGMLINPTGVLRLGVAAYNLNIEPVVAGGLALDLSKHFSLAYEILYDEGGKKRTLTGGGRIIFDSFGLSLNYEQRAISPATSTTAGEIGSDQPGQKASASKPAFSPPRFYGSLAFSSQSAVIQMGYRLSVGQFYCSWTRNF